ncbi:MAG TPA: ABC transporter permease [candidate division Zixibacteria bacterium]|jgi:ABC-type dipeptide/oligopeptide/nickel transport system permease component|nr:ABC transporter permease [candidate division Zixibacteria bacterium]
MNYIFRRLLHIIPVLFGVTLLTFSMLHLIPGDPAQILAGPDASASDIMALRQQMGLDRPLAVQYVGYLEGLARGDLGRSMSTRRPVLEELMDRFPNTLILAVAGVGVAVLLGIPIGVFAAIRARTMVDHAAMVLALLGISAPAFWLGFILMMVFSVHLGWFPSAGYRSWGHLVLPAFTLGSGAMAIVARMTRSSLLEVLNQDYVRTARAKGLPEVLVIAKHALRNALIPTTTVVGLSFGSLLGGAVLTEMVFAWPGLGRLIVYSIGIRDLPVIQGAVLLLALTFVLVNLGVDLLYGLIDPRVRRE